MTGFSDYDSWKLRSPDDERSMHEPCCERCHGREAHTGGLFDDRWLCADCLDDEAFEAREPLSEFDLDQIEYEIAEYDAA